MVKDLLIFDPFENMPQFDKRGVEFNPHHLPFMATIWPTLIISSFYLLALRICKRLMQTRAAYEFKTFLALYNFFQVILCIFFLVNAIGAGYRLDYLWKCYQPGFYNMALVKLLYLTYFIKAVELIETICFALRKKFKQMSFLHIYHHASTLIFVYLAVKKGTIGTTLTCFMLNMIVHTVMYSYYFASLFVDEKRMLNIKKSITIMQMVQFCLAIFNTFRTWQTDCGFEWELYGLFVLNVVFIFYQFYEFYKKAYVQKRNSEKRKRSV